MGDLNEPIEVDDNLYNIDNYGSNSNYLERRFFDKIFNQALELVTKTDSDEDDKKTAIRYLRYVMGQDIVHEESRRLLQIIVSYNPDLKTYCDSLIRQDDGNYISPE
jgi:hypothetical protein